MVFCYPCTVWFVNTICNGSGQDPVVEARSKGTIIYAWKAISERLLTDELSADYDSLVSTSGPLATNISSFWFESPLGQDVTRLSSESSSCYILVEFCPFRVTTRLFSKDSFYETYNCYISHQPITSPSCKMQWRAHLSTDCQLTPIQNIKRYKNFWEYIYHIYSTYTFLYTIHTFIPNATT